MIELVKKCREMAANLLQELHQEVNNNGVDYSTTNASNIHHDYYSWVTTAGKIPSTNVSDRCKFFHMMGFLLVKNFADDNEIAAMKTQMQQLVETNWDPTKKTIAFRTDEESNKIQGSDDYFLESAMRVHFFAEADALNNNNDDDEDETGVLLLPQYQNNNNKMAALNKAGHGLHMIPGAFADYTQSTKVKDLVKELGWNDPVVPQSMYIFKQPHIGGVVHSHQDSTFLYTTPRQSCLGLWLALDDATLQNGCLWVRPKSHWEPVRRRFCRNPLYFGETAIEQGSNVPLGNTTEEPKMIMETLYKDPNVPWEGLLPQPSTYSGLLDAGFVPIECKAGDLVCFPGQLDHLSLPNVSEKQRHTFQLHLVEGERVGVTWSKTNWLQYPKGTPFLSIRK